MIELLRDRVAELAALDPSCKLFGAKAHRYRFHPPYPEAELAAFERAHGFTLPDDYRAFITRIGNGGAGPSYGVIPFRGKDSEDYTDYDALGTPFPYATAYNPLDILADDADEDDEADEDDDAASDRFSDYCHAFDSRGAFYLCHHGCASRSLLIVSGPCRGQVWSDEVANNYGYAPSVDATSTRQTFTSWYMAWLDEAFRELRAP